ncbi:MAG: hypothetical protein NC079_07375 [Clostridium sp.]|nr:hypothetical protein [Acetatifactor muris]MCM1527101.1 hypothetical protein [Bacteroides sp.]MCM1563416.1 hypothetical protein [Clostridium sp.]
MDGRNFQNEQQIGQNEQDQQTAQNQQNELVLIDNGATGGSADKPKVNGTAGLICSVIGVTTGSFVCAILEESLQFFPW